MYICIYTYIYVYSSNTTSEFSVVLNGVHTQEVDTNLSIRFQVKYDVGGGGGLISGAVEVLPGDKKSQNLTESLSKY